MASRSGNHLKHSDAVRGATFTQDEQRILTWSDDGTARLWQARGVAPFGVVMNHGKSVEGASFSPDEQRILTWSEDGWHDYGKAKMALPMAR